MIILIAGASHTGKTLAAKHLTEKYQWPYLSQDHLKMGLIRAGETDLTPADDDLLTAYLWPITAGIVKTAIENRQNLVIEGCYMPGDWKKSFSEEYLKEIRFMALVMSEAYIRSHFADILSHASDVEQRLSEDDCTEEWLVSENRKVREDCEKNGLPYVLIDGEYRVDYGMIGLPETVGDPKGLHLQAVTDRNVWKLCALKVSKAQEDFVATNLESLAEAFTSVTAGGHALPFGIYDGEKPVGFVMFGYDCKDWDNPPEIAKGNYAIWRFMIDEKEQGKGCGHRAFELALQYVRLRPLGPAEYCFLSYEPENTFAAGMYHRFGFTENGEKEENETIAVLKL